MTSSNPIIDSLNNYSFGPPQGNVQLNGRFKNKFEQGFFQGIGGDSQFQQARGSTLLMTPLRTNRDLEHRIDQVTGNTVAGVPLVPSWQRSYAFAPGLGLDAAASGVTHTSRNAGLLSTMTGLTAPILSAGQDKTSEGPVPQSWSYARQGLGAMVTAPQVSADGPIRGPPKPSLADHERKPPMEVRVVK